MNYGDCEYGTPGGIYGHLCPFRGGPSVVEAAAIRARRVLDDEDTIALTCSLLLEGGH